MSAAPGGLSGFSYSTDKAMQWAAVAATHRQGGLSDVPRASIRGGDVLVGVLLAHPDPDGEAPVLLQHLGLTARDVLPPDYPVISPDDLRRGASRVDSRTPPPTEGEVSTIVQRHGSSPAGRYT